MKKLLTILLSHFSIFLLHGQVSIDSILRKAAIAKPSVKDINALFNASDYKSSDKPDSAFWIAQQAKNLSVKINYAEGEAHALFIMGKVYKQKGNYSMALELYRQSQKAYEQLNDRGGVAGNLLFTGEINAYQGDYKAALTYYLQAKSLFEQDSADFAVASTLLKIGESYELRNLPDSALLYLQQIGNLKRFKKEITEALGGRTLYSLGKVYAQRGRPDAAMNYYRQSLPALQKVNEDRVIAQVMLSVADLFQKEGKKKDSCLYYAKQSLAVAQKAGFLLELMNAADFLAHYYKQRRQSDSALAYLETTIAAKDSLFSREKVMSVQSQFFADERLKDEVAAKELQLKNQGRLIALFAASFVFMVIVFLLWRNNRQKQKANVLLEQQKQEVQNALTELKAVQRQLIHAEKMASLGEVTAGVAHEIQNPLNFINNFSDVGTELLTEAKEELEAGRTDDAKDILDELEQSLQRIRQHGARADAIVKNMLQHSRSNTGIPEPTDINGLVEECLRLSYQHTKNKDNSFQAILETRFDAGVGKVGMIPQDIGRVLLNLFSNAFYAVSEKKKMLNGSFVPTIAVSTKREGAHLLITVSDNGTGIPQKAVDKIFQPFFTTKPTGVGTGLGLSLSYDIITKGHGGELKVDTSEGEGTTFLIQLPATGSGHVLSS